MGRQGSGPLRSKWRWHVALWIPNIFTYIRIAALVKAFSVAFTDKNKFTALYSVCFVANELSRNIAHFMNYSSTFGDVLAHVSSRASNTGLLIVLSHLYKRDFRVFVLLLELDIVSHWFRIYCEVMSKRCPCLHLHLYQNSLYKNPLFRLFCALSQEIMYMTLYLISFDWMEHGHPVKLDFLRNKDYIQSKYFKSLVVATPGYLIRQIATLDEIRLATDMCIHFDHQKYCRDKSPQPPCEPPAQPHLHLVTSTRRGRSKSRPRKRTRSRSKDRFDHTWYATNSFALQWNLSKVTNLSKVILIVGPGFDCIQTSLLHMTLPNIITSLM